MRIVDLSVFKLDVEVGKEVISLNSDSSDTYYVSGDLMRLFDWRFDHALFTGDNVFLFFKKVFGKEESTVGFKIQEIKTLKKSDGVPTLMS